MQKRKKGFAVFTQRLEKMQEKPLMSHSVDLVWFVLHQGLAQSVSATVENMSIRWHYSHTLSLYYSYFFMLYYDIKESD